MKTLNKLAAIFALVTPIFAVQPAEADFLRDATRSMRDINRMLNEADRMQRNFQRFGTQPHHRNQNRNRARLCEDRYTGQVFVQSRCDRRYERDRGPVYR